MLFVVLLYLLGLSLSKTCLSVNSSNFSDECPSESGHQGASEAPTVQSTPPYNSTVQDVALQSASGKRCWKIFFILICFLSRVGMQLSQVLTPSQRKERFVSLQRRRQRQVGRDRNLRPSPPSCFSRQRRRRCKMRAWGRRMLEQTVMMSTKTTLWRATPPQWRSPPPQSHRLHSVQESPSCSCHFLRWILDPEVGHQRQPIQCWKQFQPAH